MNVKYYIEDTLHYQVSNTGKWFNINSSIIPHTVDLSAILNTRRPKDLYVNSVRLRQREFRRVL